MNKEPSEKLCFAAKIWAFRRDKEAEQKARRRSQGATSRTFCEDDAVAAKRTNLQPKDSFSEGSKLICVVLITLALIGCGSSSLTTVGNPKKPIDIQLTNDIDNPDESIAAVTTVTSDEDCRSGEGACYTPPIYLFALRNIGLISCDGDSCPGEAGMDLESLGLTLGTDFTALTLAEPLTDFILYEDTSESLDILGTDFATISGEIEVAGIYDGVQMAIDFVIVQIPTSVLADPENLDIDYALLCMNTAGCHTVANDYGENYADLANGDVLAEDIVFLNVTSDNSVEFFHYDLEDDDGNPLVALAEGRPNSPLTQAGIPDTWESTTEGSLIYNASCGSLADITVTADSTETTFLRLDFAVNNAASFADEDGDLLINTAELASFEFGKPTITSNGVSVSN